MSKIQYKIFREELDTAGNIHYYSCIIKNPFFKTEYFPGKWISPKKGISYGLLTYNTFKNIQSTCPILFGKKLDALDEQYSVWIVECKNEMNTMKCEGFPLIYMNELSLDELLEMQNKNVRRKKVPFYKLNKKENPYWNIFEWPSGTRMFKQIKMIEKIYERK